VPRVLSVSVEAYHFALGGFMSIAQTRAARRRIKNDPRWRKKRLRADAKRVAFAKQPKK